MRRIFNLQTEKDVCIRKLETLPLSSLFLPYVSSAIDDGSCSSSLKELTTRSRRLRYRPRWGWRSRRRSERDWEANIRVNEKNLLNFSSSALLANNIIDSGITFQSTMFTYPFHISSSFSSAGVIHWEVFTHRTIRP